MMFLTVKGIGLLSHKPVSSPLVAAQVRKMAKTMMPKTTNGILNHKLIGHPPSFLGESNLLPSGFGG